MKLLIFASTPPPHHGQSYAVQLMIDGLKQSSSADQGGFEIYHVNARFSEDFGEVGRFRWRKFLRLFQYCGQAISQGLRGRVGNLYYVPAPGKRVPLYRDWLVMLLCRPFFPRVIYHWHSAGLGEWLQQHAKPWERWFTLALMGKNHLSIVLGSANRSDASVFQSKSCVIVPNGIPDPCPNYDSGLRLRRSVRRSAGILAAKTPCLAGAQKDDTEPLQFRVLFLSTCTREKGLFDCLDAVALLNQKLREDRVPVVASLSVAGTFTNPLERAEFESCVARHGMKFLEGPGGGGRDVVRYYGFAAGDEKRRLFEECDVFCFPTFFSAESFGLVLLEAMAYDLPVVTTSWRALPELLPEGYPGIVPPKDPKAIARALEYFLRAEETPDCRARFLGGYTEAHFIQNMRAAFLQHPR